MHISDWKGFCKIVGLVRAGLPLPAIVDSYGRAVHYEAQVFTRTQRIAKLHVIRALVTSWKNCNFKELDRIVSDGKKNEAGAKNGPIRANENRVGATG